jgi:hypothetical protein
VVPSWREGQGAAALAPDYQRLLGVLDTEPDRAGLRVKDLAVLLELELTPAKIEGVRFRAKRLVERGWLVEERPGVFMPRWAAG